MTRITYAVGAKHHIQALKSRVSMLAHAPYDENVPVGGELMPRARAHCLIASANGRTRGSNAQ